MGYFDPLPIFRNFVEVELKEALSSSSTTMRIKNIERFPAVILQKDFLPCVIRDAARSVREVVYVTAVNPNNDSLTIERAREGSVARNWPVDTTYVYLTFTADTVQRLRAGGFAPVLDSNGVRPAIKRLSDSSVQLTGAFSEIEQGIAVRMMRNGGGYVVPRGGEIGIFASEVTISGGKTTLEIINGVVPSDIVGIDIGVYKYALPGTMGDNIYVTAAGGTRARTLNDHFGDFINVKDYGARGDGTTNDTAAFKAAKEAANAKNAVVYVPYGTYKVTENISGAEFATLGHVSITGGGSVPITDLFNDFVRLKGDQVISGSNTFKEKATFEKGLDVGSGGITVSSGGITVSHGKGTFKDGLDVSGGMTVSGIEVHNGTETHNGPVTFSNGVTFADSAGRQTFINDLLATENNGFYAPASAGGKLRVDPSEFIVSNGGLMISAANNINKLKVKASDLLTASGGLAVDSNDKMYVKFDSMDPDVMRNIVLAMVQSGGGIAVDSNGQLYVDFGSMPTDKFEAMLASLKMQAPLTANKSLYVDNVLGSDTITVDGVTRPINITDNNVGTSSKPFASINACVSYATAKYAVGAHNVYINIKTNADNPYRELVVLPMFNRSTGAMVLQAADADHPPTITNRPVSGSIQTDQQRPVRCTGGVWYLHNIITDSVFSALEDGVAHFPGAIGVSGGSTELIIRGCSVSTEFLGAAPSNGHFLRLFSVTDGGRLSLSVRAGCHNAFECIKGNATAAYFFHLERLARVEMPSANIVPSAETTNEYTIPCSGAVTAFLTISTNSIFTIIGGGQYYQEFVGSSVTGKTYNIVAGSGVLAPSDGFPGDTSGTVEDTTYCWYKTV